MRAIVSSGEYIIAELMLRQPREGVWRARVKVASPDVLEGEPLAIDDGNGHTWRGTARAVVRVGPQTVVDVVGGAGQLDALTTARYYAGGINAASLLADLCGDVGEQADSSYVVPLGPWRVRGGSLRYELATLARLTTGAYRIVPGGAFSLLVASGEVAPPGRFRTEDRLSRSFEASDLRPLAGHVVAGWEVGTALWTRSAAEPLRVSLWLAEHARAAAPPAVVGGVVSGSSRGRVDVTTDQGETLADVPLFSVVGYLPSVAVGARVLVVDLGDDPRATIALAGASDADADDVELAGGDVPLAMAGVVEALDTFANGVPVPTDGGAAVHATFKAAWSTAKAMQRVQSQKVKAQ